MYGLLLIGIFIIGCGLYWLGRLVEKINQKKLKENNLEIFEILNKRSKLIGIVLDSNLTFENKKIILEMISEHFDKLVGIKEN